MKLSSYNTKKISSFCHKKAFLIFLVIEPCTFQHKPQKEQKVHPEKISYNSGNENAENGSYIFLKRKLFLYLRERKPLKNTLYLRKRNFLIFRERYIQNPNMFRTTSISRTLVYSELETHSKHCKISTMNPFSFNIKKFVLFR